ncbi:DUF6886 family protein [Paenibacillus sp. FSL W7-1287]|uniref:DUF6886 family protein n=1 Tax=Paenibacillus sp. FSL W7-1287 TaxID=2954538 RepID=UPI0030F80DBF
MFLYHFSEESDIKIFHPRKNLHHEHLPPVVWAIDEEHSVNYLFPRDCPRVIFRRSERMSKEDELHFFRDSHADTIIAVENDWLEQISNTKLFRYTFPKESFEMEDGIAGYYISTVSVEPLRIEPIENLLLEIVKRKVELRFTPNLYPIKESILSSSIDDYSIIRFRNAKQ